MPISLFVSRHKQDLGAPVLHIFLSCAPQLGPVHSFGRPAAVELALSPPTAPCLVPSLLQEYYMIGYLGNLAVRCMPCARALPG